MTRAVLLVVLIMLVCASAVSAQLPSTSFNYQGKLVGSDGQPVPDGTHSIRFRLYTTETGGSIQWEGTYSVQVSGGVFSATVGPVPTDLFVALSDCWLALEVDGTALSPRTKLLQVPYAGRAFKADQAEHANRTDYAVEADRSTQASYANMAYSVADYGVGSASLQHSLYFRGSPTVQGSLLVSDGNGTGSGLIISDAGKFADMNDDWLTLLTPGFRVRNFPNDAWSALESGSQVIHGDATVEGNLSVNGTLNANVALPDNSITSAKIADGTIQLSDIGANGAAAGQVIKCGPSGWVVAADNDTVYMAGQGISISGGAISIAPGGVGAYQLGTSDADAGDVLTYDGSNTVWQPSPGFSLPYTGSISSTINAFSVTNTGTGNAASFGGNVAVTGRLTASTDLRSPIFYDSSDTNYYVDPAATTQLNDVRANIIYDRNNTSYYVDPASTSYVNNLTVSGTLNATSLDSRYLRKDLGATGVQTLYGDIDLRDANGNSYLHLGATDAGANWTCIASQVFNSPNYYGPNSTATIYLGESNPVHVRGHLSTPKLYDYNDTNYFVDPAGISLLADLRAYVIYDLNDPAYYVNPSSTSLLYNVQAGVFTDKDDTSYYVNPASTSQVNDLRANIVYDRSDTNYYVDPASTSQVNNLNVEGTLTVGTTPIRSPLAYAFINADGSKASGTSNVSSVWNAVNSYYEITISGESYYFNSYVTTVTPSASSPRIATTTSLGGKMLVFICDLAGNRVQCTFQFTTYKP